MATVTQAPPSGAGQTRVEVAELVRLCALDNPLYGRTFFPGTFRQKSPHFHSDISDLLEDRQHRHVAIMVFRGGAKTTLLRVYTSKRVAYGVSRTILLVSESQDHSKKSLAWLRRQVDKNRLWTQVYGLSRGAKWSEELIEIYHAKLDISITIIAVGITGQVRGVNIDDYRPDLVVVDDPCNEENTGTPEQRQKLSDLFFGALEKSLAPVSESPDAKMVLLQTPLQQEDLVSLCCADPQWASRSYGCFKPDGTSIWEERFSTSTLLADKEAHAHRGQLKLWMREMENTIVGGELAVFRQEWLRYWEILPEKLRTYIGIDPVPPPSEREMAMGMSKKDYEALAVVGCYKGEYYLLEYTQNRGHTPEWTAMEFFRLVDKWKPIRCRVEGIAYQRTLKWILEQKMKERGRFVQLDAVSDKRRKTHRIIQAISGLASNNRLYIHRTHVDFETQYLGMQPTGGLAHEDLLDAVSMALDAASELEVFNDVDVEREETEALPEWRSAP